uniref:Reverse transcriptase domain-containing protein n=1 Tax=Lactuca sativa TaxID=4236 RepID=A0A9R1UXV6_LACSA|nr:hypothetical protein LSAT_V11C700378140 [Lactuca sativa]
MGIKDEIDLVRPKIINDNFKKISEEDRDMLEASLSLDEVKNAIWSCGSHKAPRPDGFTFKFLKEFWDVLKDDIFKRVKYWLQCLFISLIQKKLGPLYLNDYRPINLIGCMHKILSKLLSLRLKKVLGRIIGLEQSAYVEGRSILDGPFIINEIFFG